MNHQKISIIGLGKTGIAVANYCLRNGIEVFVSEADDDEKVKNNLRLIKGKFAHELGGHSEKILDSSRIIKSPGVPSHLPVLTQAKNRGIKIISEIEFAYNIIKPAKIVAITGTNGKTTTTTMAGEIFKTAGLQTVVCGNIGAPISDFIEKITPGTIVVLEVSSYQLEDIVDFKPDIACILNITPDHLEHHNSMDNYTKAKMRIFENQTQGDYCVLNYDDTTVSALGNKNNSKVVYFSQKTDIENSARYANGILKSPFSRRNFHLCLQIPGNHNIENALAAFTMAELAGIKPEVAVKALNEFPGVEHRLELVRKIKGVEYINDSKSTNVDSTFVALKSFGKNVILIMGGRDKGAPYIPLRDIVRQHVKKILLVGEAANKIKKDLDGASEIIECRDIERALKYAFANATPGDTVLLSPGCSSFDQFKNYEQRGSFFKELVRKL